jgi:hypothetical protein
MPCDQVNTIALAKSKPENPGAVTLDEGFDAACGFGI